MNEKQGVIYADAKTEGERAQVAATCVRNLKIDFPVLVDSMDNSVERAYTGWPDRLYVVDKDSRIAFKGGPGPFGFKPREMEAALKKAL